MSDTDDDITATAADTVYLHTVANGDGVSELSCCFCPSHSPSSANSLLSEFHTLQVDVDPEVSSGTGKEGIYLRDGAPLCDISNKTYTLRPKLGEVRTRMMKCPSGKADDGPDFGFEEGKVSEAVNCPSLLVSQVSTMSKALPVEEVLKRTTDHTGKT